jgi:hypothetical protein
MARVRCEVEEILLENEEGREVPGVVATCERCQHQVESFGTEEPSILRCLAIMREECPEGQRNFYVTDEGDEE